MQLQQSGYLLRKFKNSPGWQKLWVVFTDFCLFFFKNNQESHPLASLPLIGYRVTVPSLDDNIEKDHVIKLYFTAHKYFLRTDSEYSFQRYGAYINNFFFKFNFTFFFTFFYFY